MEVVSAVILPVVVLAVACIGLQVCLTRRMLELKGKDTPEVEGAAGRRVANGRAALFTFAAPRAAPAGR